MRAQLSLALGLLLLSTSVVWAISPDETVSFGPGYALENGDVNGDWDRDLTDPVYFLNHIFLGGPNPVPLAWCGVTPPAVENGDMNGDKVRDISDAIRMLEWLYGGGQEIAAACEAEGSIAGGKGNVNPRVIPPNARAHGKAYGDWGGAWWAWAFSIPASVNPVLDSTGENCAEGQSGSVWFLAGSFGDPVERTCSVPAGKALFFPLINTECSTIEDAPFFCDSVESCAECNSVFYSDEDDLSVTVDGRDLGNLLEYRVQSTELTEFSTPAEDDILGMPGATGRLGAGGYWLMLAPLSRGEHTIHFEATLGGGPFAGFSQNVTYVINVE